MNHKLSKLAPPIRGLRFALIYATLWFLILWAIAYPIDQWVGVVALAYVALRASQFVIGSLSIASIKMLRKRGLQAAERAGIELPDAAQSVDGITPKAHAVVVLLLLSVLATIFGSSFIVMVYWASAVGLYPLSPYFLFAGIALTVAGLFILALFFAISLMLFALTQSLSKSNELSRRIRRIEQSEETLVQHLGSQTALFDAA